jgi:hypothetical protein
VSPPNIAYHWTAMGKREINEQLSPISSQE